MILYFTIKCLLYYTYALLERENESVGRTSGVSRPRRMRMK